jgi:hypothetical protein
VSRRLGNADCLDVEFAGSAAEDDQQWFYRLAYNPHVTVTATVVASPGDLDLHRALWLPVLDSLLLSRVEVPEAARQQ